MPIDINEFKQAFVDDSMEMLQAIEKTLLHININAPIPDDIDLIFRSMHSIKGNSIVFGFNLITNFSHILESFFDQIRKGQQILNNEHINFLLKSIDRLRIVLINIQNKVTLDESYVTDLENYFKSQLLPTKETGKKLKTSKNEKIPRWIIVYKPNRNSLQKGNEPSRLFMILKELGSLDVKIDSSNLAEFPDMDPTECYLSWQLKLNGEVSKKEIDEVIEWLAKEESVTIFEEDIVMEDAIAARYFIQNADGDFLDFQFSTVRVSTEKLDALINIVGELVISNSMLTQIVQGFEMKRLRNLNEGMSNLERNIQILQNRVMRIRMIPIEFIFNRVPRLVHDLVEKLHKEVELKIIGEATELDRNMIEKLSDPIMHIVRNALDHGIEMPEERLKKGKQARGLLKLTADQEGSSVVIDIHDDGTGLNKLNIQKKAIAEGLLAENEELTDEKIQQLIFKAGFSTASELTNVSGRGVGLDVVYNNIKDLGGSIEVFSEENKGTTFKIRLPLTLAILECQLIKLGNELYILPLNSIIENLKIDAMKIISDKSGNTYYQFRNETIPLIDLHTIFKITNNDTKFENKFIIVVKVESKLYGFVVDELLSQQQVFIKNLEENYKPIPGIYGVTILGTGVIALIIDAKAVVNIAFNSSQFEKMTTDSRNYDLPIIYDEFISAKYAAEFISFKIKDEILAINLASVIEIRAFQKPTRLPNTQFFIKGVINVRGMIIPVLDLNAYLELPPQKLNFESVIVIVGIHLKGKIRQIGIIIDRILNTFSLNKKDINQTEKANSIFLNDYIYGIAIINNEIISLLKIEELVSVALLEEYTS